MIGIQILTLGLAIVSSQLYADGAVDASPPVPVVQAWLFTTDCGTCRRGMQTIQETARRNGVRLELHVFRLKVEDNPVRLLAIENLAGGTRHAVPTLIVGDKILGGLGELQRDLPGVLRKARAEAERTGGIYRSPLIIRYEQSQQTATRPDSDRLALDHLRGYGTWAVLGSGLIDGINPCAFSAMAFLLSYLAMVGRSRRGLLITGGVFCGTMFVCYLLIGALLGATLAQIGWRSAVGQWVRWGMVVLTLGFAGVSLYDTILAARGRGRDMLLKLPDIVQKRLHGSIRNYAKTGGLFLSTIALAAIITLLETVCTGQLYLPTVGYVVGRGLGTWDIWAHLLLYCAAFVLPLIILFLLVAFGVSSQTFTQLYRRAMPAVKGMMTAVFLAIAGLLVWSG